MGAVDLALVKVAAANQAIAGSRSMAAATQTEDGRLWFVAEDENRDPILYLLADE